ncbi:hypothetical protein [Tulasnella ambivirus 4]|uniref:Uncharacterized protein n=1 Tax=Tulasnella ambivirus 4 TaxID=2772292 RepID=A0A7S7YF65_9VIRU|nr:hypothetical protein [Tulasnella ambivirus 4]
MTASVYSVLRLNEHLQTISPDLNLLLRNIVHYPFSWRKATLKHCRIQRSSITNRHVKELYSHVLDIHLPNFPHGDGYGKAMLEALNNTLLDYSPVTASIVSAFVRCELYTSRDEPWFDVLEESINKELNASQAEDSPRQLDYAFLFPDNPQQLTTLLSSQDPAAFVMFRDPDDLFHNARLYRTWIAGIAQLKERLESPSQVFSPVYSRKKNVSTVTAANYREYLTHFDQYLEEEEQVTTLSLQKLYFEKGYQVPGPMELRTAWKYNDLKPRVYYASGGTGYFASCILRSIIKMMLSILPCTHPNLRYDVTRVTAVRPIQTDEYLVTYDYASFTTSLSELKYFVDALSRFFRGTKVKVLDFYQGVIEEDLGDYLLAYNHTVNVHPAFDVNRIKEDLFWVPSYHQLRSGMLGIQGNIGLSTILHGIHISRFADGHQHICCVGDDCLDRVHRDQYTEYIQHVNILGEISPDRFTTWVCPPGYYEEEQFTGEDETFPFCKRPTLINAFGEVETEYLPPFPNIAALLDIHDDYHTPQFGLLRSTKPNYDRFVIFAKQVGVYYNRVRAELPETSYSFWEQEAVIAILAAAYDYCNIHTQGCFPHLSPYAPVVKRKSRDPRKRHRARVYKDNTERLAGDGPKSFPIFIPPCDVECFQRPWEEILAENYMGRVVHLPATSPVSIHPEYCSGVGWTMVCTPYVLQRVAVDLGFMESSIVTYETTVDEGTGEMIKNVTWGAERPLYRYTCISDPPSWYNDVISKLMPVVPTAVEPYVNYEDEHVVRDMLYMIG